MYLRAGPSAGALGENARRGGAADSCHFSWRGSDGNLCERLKKLLCVPFKFSTRGSHVVLYEPEKLYDQSLASERNVIYGQEGQTKLETPLTLS
jgi:hypothetical protein